MTRRRTTSRQPMSPDWFLLRSRNKRTVAHLLLAPARTMCGCVIIADDLVVAEGDELRCHGCQRSAGLLSWERAAPTFTGPRAEAKTLPYGPDPLVEHIRIYMEEQIRRERGCLWG